MKHLNFKRKAVSDPATLTDCASAVTRLHRRLGQPVYRRLLEMIQHEIAAESSYWKLSAKDGKKQTYTCSTCGSCSAIPNRYCLKCGAPKFDSSGAIKRCK